MAVETLDEGRKSKLLIPADERAAPLEIEMPMTAVSEVDVGLQAESLVEGIGRNVGDLFGADKVLIGAGTAGEVVMESGDVN